ncbi:MAG: helix-turn-helix transcriptional regulator [Acidimicrobiia bacterium]
MAALIGISASQLRRLFMHHFGATPRQRLCNLRLEAAARLLADPSMRIKEIQLRVGIADASHFCRDFRQRFGVSPSEYRESLLHLLRTDTTDSDARRRQEMEDSAH